MIPFFLSLLLTVYPAETKTSWMRPEVFNLTIGMDRIETVRTLRRSGWQPRTGRDANELVVDYSDEKSLTLHFRDERLRSVRFELFTFRSEIRKAFDSARDDLKKERGEPKPLPSKSIVLYDNALPNVMMVVADDPNSAHGKKGLGVLAVRYFDPRAEK